MLVKNRVLFDAVFSTSLRKILKLDLDWDIAIQLAKTVQILDSERAIVYPLLNSLMLDYGVEEMSETVRIKDEDRKEEFLSKLENLMSQEFEIPLKNKLDLKGYKITTEDILNLKDIVGGMN